MKHIFKHSMPYVVIHMLCRFSNYVFNILRIHCIIIWNNTMWGFLQLLLSKEEHNTAKFKWLSRLPRINLFHVRTILLFELISNPLPVFLMLSLSFKHYLSKTASSTFTKIQSFSYKFYVQARERKDLGIHSLQNSSCKIFLFITVALWILCFDVERQKNKRGEGSDRGRLLHRPGQLTNLPQRYFECLPSSS